MWSKRVRIGGRVWAMAVATLAAGCGGDARVELAAADVMQSLARAFAETVEEYHAELNVADTGRESAVAQALVARVRRDVGDDDRLDAHAAEFVAAIERIRADREVEWRRYHAALDHAAALRETATEMRQVALASLSLNDELQRYVYSLLDVRRRTEGEVQ